jgi:hypothetical protein
MQKETVETRKLSRAAIETLAIIAYHQPVTRAEIEEIRGVSVSRGTVDQLLELEWIRFGRRKMTPGRPVTFVVTQGFLDHFGLESARDLPGLKELRAAGLLENRPPPGNAWTASGPDPGNSRIAPRHTAPRARVIHALVDQPPHDLPVFQHEGRLVAAHLQHPARSRAPAASWPKPGSKKPA